MNAELTRSGRKAWSLARDLAGPGSDRKLVEGAERLTGGLDILVINASTQINAALGRADPEHVDLQIDVNLKSTLEMLQACLPKMAVRGWGRVVSTGSINHLRPKDIVSSYAATKAAQHNLVQSQARDYYPTIIALMFPAVSCIAGLDRQHLSGWP